MRKRFDSTVFTCLTALGVFAPRVVGDVEVRVVRNGVAAESDTFAPDLTGVVHISTDSIDFSNVTLLRIRPLGAPEPIGTITINGTNPPTGGFCIVLANSNADTACPEATDTRDFGASSLGSISFSSEGLRNAARLHLSVSGSITGAIDAGQVLRVAVGDSISESAVLTAHNADDATLGRSIERVLVGNNQAGDGIFGTVAANSGSIDFTNVLGTIGTPAGVQASIFAAGNIRVVQATSIRANVTAGGTVGFLHTANGNFDGALAAGPLAGDAAARESACPGDLADDFESYPIGTVCRPNGWEQWAGSTDVCAATSSGQSFDGGRSLLIVGNPGGSAGMGDNIVRRIVSANSGRWVFRANTFVTESSTGKGYISLLSVYDDPPGAPPSTNRWGLRVGFDADAGMVVADPNAGSILLARERWVEFRAEIDLDADTVDYYYDDVPFVLGRSWTQALGPVGPLQIQAINLYGGEPASNGITGFFIDGLTLRGSCPIPDCNGNELDDTIELLEGLLTDANHNGRPDECECVADVDDGTGSGMPDGGVTIDDLLFYLQVFDAGDIRADVDDGTSTGTPDGGVTIDDLLYYLARFDSGC